MFGYITPVEDELKVKDFKIFKGYYCGLCFEIKNKYGNIPRTAINYDLTFFALLLDSFSIGENIIENSRCIKHPFSKTNYIKGNEALRYAADLNILLVYYKLCDNIYDDNDVKSKFLFSLSSIYHTKLKNSLIDKIIKVNLDKLHELEKNKNFGSLDEISHYFSNIIGQILKRCPFPLSCDNVKVREKLYYFGYAFGKWIYLMDALEDLKKDMEGNKFNPIDTLYNTNNLSYEELFPLIKEDLDFDILSLSLYCSDTLKELPITKNKDILDNVINLGLIEKYMNISNKL